MTKRVCLTPGAIYNVEIQDKDVAVEVKLNRPLNLTSKKAAQLDRQLHNALEKVLAPYMPKDIIYKTLANKSK